MGKVTLGCESMHKLLLHVIHNTLDMTRQYSAETLTSLAWSANNILLRTRECMILGTDSAACNGLLSRGWIPTTLLSTRPVLECLDPPRLATRYTCLFPNPHSSCQFNRLSENLLGFAFPHSLECL
jgi:hypothetical protein